jgi:hypothetical protein
MTMQYDVRQPNAQQQQNPVQFSTNPQQQAQQAVNTALQRYQTTIQYATWQALQEQAQHNPVAHSILDAIRAGVEVPGLENIFPGRKKTNKALRRNFVGGNNNNN